MSQERKELIRILYEVFQCFELSRKQCAKALGKSTATIDRLRANGIGPKFKKDKRSKNGRVTYPIFEVAKHMQSDIIETFKANS
jgi:hypothetical protein